MRHEVDLVLVPHPQHHVLDPRVPELHIQLRHLIECTCSVKEGQGRARANACIEGSPGGRDLRAADYQQLPLHHQCSGKNASDDSTRAQFRLGAASCRHNQGTASCLALILYYIDARISYILLLLANRYVECAGDWEVGGNGAIPEECE